MECGAHGPAGRLVVKHVVSVHRKGGDSVITQSPLTMVHTAWVLDLRCKSAIPQVLVQVSFIYKDHRMI